MNMIEIEVEMEMQVAAAELAGIEEQLVRLEELEELKGEWQVQAEAQDEVRGFWGKGFGTYGVDIGGAPSLGL